MTKATKHKEVSKKSAQVPKSRAKKVEKVQQAVEEVKKKDRHSPG